MPAWILCLLTLVTFTAYGQDIRLTENDIQQQLQALMPLHHQQGPLLMVIDEPSLTLLADSNRIGLRVRMQLTSSLGLQSRGWLSASSGIRYEREEYAFYLQNPELTEIHIEGMSPALQMQIKPLIETWLLPALSQQPMYRLREDDMMEAMARNMLQSITVEHDAVVLRLKMF